MHIKKLLTFDKFSARSSWLVVVVVVVPRWEDELHHLLGWGLNQVYQVTSGSSDVGLSLSLSLCLESGLERMQDWINQVGFGEYFSTKWGFKDGYANWLWFIGYSLIELKQSLCKWNWVIKQFCKLDWYNNHIMILLSYLCFYLTNVMLFFYCFPK